MMSQLAIGQAGKVTVHAAYGDSVGDGCAGGSQTRHEEQQYYYLYDSRSGHGGVDGAILTPEFHVSRRQGEHHDECEDQCQQAESDNTFLYEFRPKKREKRLVKTRVATR